MTDNQNTAKTHIKRYRESQKNIKQLRECIDTLIARINSTTSTPKDVQVQSSGGTPKDELICTLADKHDEYYIMQSKAERVCKEIECNIELIESDISKRILRGYFIQSKSFEQIAVDENYCWRQIIRMYCVALDEYYERMGGER